MDEVEAVGDEHRAIDHNGDISTSRNPWSNLSKLATESNVTLAAIKGTMGPK